MSLTKTCASLSLVLSLATGTTKSWSAPITFSYTGNDSGTLNGVPFEPRNFVITAHANTNNRELARVGGATYGWFIDHGDAEIAIDGFPIISFLSGTRTFVNTSTDVVGFSRATTNGLDLYTGWLDPILNGWDMTTGIGPLNGQGNLREWDFSPAVQTTGGQLVFDVKFMIPATFQAIVAPEPSTAALLVIGCVVALVVRRR